MGFQLGVQIENKGAPTLPNPWPIVGPPPLSHVPVYDVQLDPEAYTLNR